VLGPTPALDLSPEVRLPEGGLLSIALDPEYSQNGFLYALYAAAAPRDGLEFILARFRGVDGVFAERAVLLDRINASPAKAGGVVRFGPDGKLFVALDGADDLQAAGSFTTYNGKVLRLNADATMVDGQGNTPVLSMDHPRPIAIDWQPDHSTLWVVDRLDADAGRLSAVSIDAARESRADARVAYALPSGSGASSAMFYRGLTMPMFRGNLFIAAEQGRYLMRLTFDGGDPMRVATVEHLLQDIIGPIRVVAAGADDALYVASDAALYRLSP
jgi:glucose/arabinose dehydrogenase